MEAPARATSLPELLETQSKTLKGGCVGGGEGRPIHLPAARKPIPLYVQPSSRLAVQMTCQRSHSSPLFREYPFTRMNNYSPCPARWLHGCAPLACIVMQCGRWSGCGSRSVASAVEQVERLRRVAGGSASAPAMVERLACSTSAAG